MCALCVLGAPAPNAALLSTWYGTSVASSVVGTPSACSSAKQTALPPLLAFARESNAGSSAVAEIHMNVCVLKLTGIRQSSCLGQLS